MLKTNVRRSAIALWTGGLLLAAWLNGGGIVTSQKALVVVAILLGALSIGAILTVASRWFRMLVILSDVQFQQRRGFVVAVAFTSMLMSAICLYKAWS
jgi:hypothetical protein